LPASALCREIAKHKDKAIKNPIQNSRSKQQDARAKQRLAAARYRNQTFGRGGFQSNGTFAAT
jgi:hypothetical protein